MRKTLRVDNLAKKMAEHFCADSILRINVCASTFRNLNGREATISELSRMTGIPAILLAIVYGMDFTTAIKPVTAA